MVGVALCSYGESVAVAALLPTPTLRTSHVVALLARSQPADGTALAGTPQRQRSLRSTVSTNRIQ